MSENVWKFKETDWCHTREKRCWRTEFEVHPKLAGFAYPRCIQHSSATKGYRVCGMFRSKEVPLHVIKYTLAGCGMISVDGFPYRVPKGSAFLATVTNSEIEYYYPDDSRETWEFVFMAFYGLDDIVKNLNNQFGWVHKVPENSWLVKSLLGYRDRANAIQLLSPGEANAFVQTQLGEIADINVSIRDKGHPNDLFHQVSLFVNRHLEEQFGLADIADHLGVSKEHLCRQFKTETGMTVLEYIQRERIRYARLLLNTRNLSVKEIACRLGFSYPSHFNRLFRKLEGMTPLEYQSNRNLYE